MKMCITCISWAVQEVVVGITTGQVLCACVGSKTRAEYTVYGDAINLSARLMGAAQEGLTHVLCDDATRQLALRSAAFYRLDPIQARKR